MDESDALYVGATIHTCGRPGTTESMLVRDGRVAAVGPLREMEAAAGTAVRRVDLSGLTVIPGFNDSHCHILWIGMNLRHLDVSRDAVRTIADIGRAVRARAANSPSDAWIEGTGYDQNALEDRRHPTRHDLDDAAGGRPVVLHHTSGHVLTCNTAALRAAGITAETDSPAGGEIDRDPAGMPTGVLKESAMKLIADVLPAPTVSDGTDAIVQATRHMASLGITSATDLNTADAQDAWPYFEMYRRAVQTGELKTRIGLTPNIMHVAPPDGDQVRDPREFDLKSDPTWLTIRATKLFSDGALSTRTAALRDPYAAEPHNEGILIWPRETLAGMISRAHAAGWQIATHALGDRAVETVIRCYAEALAAFPRRDHRHRIEHLMLLDAAMVAAMRELGIVPVMQPDIFRLGDGYVTALGIERAQQVIPMALFRESGVTVAFSSDAPVIPSDPLLVIRSAMERTTPTGDLLGPEHRVPAMQAIEHYTRGSAWATHTDRHLGTLEPGKLADFTVLSADPARTVLDDWHTVSVVQTVVDGVETYRA